MFPPNELSYAGQFLFVTDELSSPADFILHRTLSAHLKGKTNSRCLILSVSEDLTRWKTIASKSNLNLSTPDLLVFIDLADELQLATLQGDPGDKYPLRVVYDRVSNVLSTADCQTLVILDDISSLEWIGFSTLDLTRFSRALRAVCLKSSASLVIRHHIVTPDEPDELFRHLLQMCTYHMDVLPLSSGRSGTISGEIALHPGPTVHASKIQAVPRSLAIQYRLTDTGCIFFERGTSGGVL